MKRLAVLAALLIATQAVAQTGSIPGGAQSVASGVGTSLQLSSNPDNCAGGEFAKGIDTTGAAEGCATPAGGGDMSGPGAATVNNELMLWNGTSGTSAKRATATGVLVGESGVLSGVDPTACSSGTWVRDITGAAALTCTAPAFSEITGSVTDAQVPDTITVNTAAVATAALSTTQFTINPPDCTEYGGHTYDIAIGILADGTATCAPLTDNYIPDTVTVTDWTLGAAYATAPSSNNNSTRVPTSAWVQTEIGELGGVGLTMTSGVADIDAGVYTRTCDFNIEAPESGDDGVFQCYFPTAATITRVYCSTSVGDTSNVQLYERAEATPNTGVTEMLTADLACDSDGQATTAFADSAVAADKVLALGIQTPFTAGVLRVHVEYTVAN